MIYMKVRVLF